MAKTRRYRKRRGGSSLIHTPKIRRMMGNQQNRDIDRLIDNLEQDTSSDGLHPQITPLMNSQIDIVVSEFIDVLGREKYAEFSSLVGNEGVYNIYDIIRGLGYNPIDFKRNPEDLYKIIQSIFLNNRAMIYVRTKVPTQPHWFPMPGNHEQSLNTYPGREAEDEARRAEARRAELNQRSSTSAGGNNEFNFDPYAEFGDFNHSFMGNSSLHNKNENRKQNKSRRK